MDDICTGAATLEEADELKHNLVKTLENHRFELKKWSSSTPELLEGIPREDCASGTLSFDEGTVTRVLGLNWNSEEDSLGYNFSSIKFVHTKRGVLSVIGFMTL